MTEPYNPKVAGPIDFHVGRRIRERRLLLGLSQTDLAEGLQVTFQQVQKYEKGINRVGASRLQRTADILGVPVAYFFGEMNDLTDASPDVVWHLKVWRPSVGFSEVESCVSTCLFGARHANCQST